jgi:dipeptidyl-peptidase-4
VQSALPAQLLRQWFADHGYVVVAVDGRGTPGRGRAFERALKEADEAGSAAGEAIQRGAAASFSGPPAGGSFGRVPLDDQVDALRALATTRPEMDLARVGIYGWSFGGYLAALAVLRRPDVFHVGIAGAPVVEWRDYDTCYTERYLGLPDENRAGYDDSSLLPLASELSRPLLLIHGTTDDNVYFLHSLKLADALFRAGRPFELLPLQGFTHMVPDPAVRERLYTRILATLGAALHP